MNKVLVALCVLGLSAASLAQAIEWMELMDVDTGWVATNHHLFRTLNGGRNWKNVTPLQRARDKQISGVFFLDASRGWIVLSSDDNDADTTYFWLASTMDAGTTWTVRHIDIPEWYMPPQPAILDDSTLAIHFWDERRGLIGVSGGGLALTLDAGKTWRLVSTPGLGQLLFATRNDGWLLGSSAKYEFNGELFVTHDGAQSWQHVLLRGPTSEANATYGIPIFTDKDHAFVTVNYSGPKIQSTALFSSTDGGHTWKKDYVLPSDPHSRFTAVDAQWRIVKLDQHRLIVDQPAGTFPSSAAGKVDPEIVSLDKVIFIDKLHGWVLGTTSRCDSRISGCAQLLSTADSGATWTNISPSNQRIRRP
jgi:photosystem II stability/assembly factor-like uncharacterized protein